MDSSGHWHKTRSGIMESFREPARDFQPTMRPVIEIAFNESVTVVKSDGNFLRCAFMDCEKNKVTLKPIEQNRHQPYFELAERVQLTRENGESVAAQIWDNRKGVLILRTLPVGM